jgi:hypothetical protein
MQLVGMFHGVEESDAHCLSSHFHKVLLDVYLPISTYSHVVFLLTMELFQLLILSFHTCESVHWFMVFTINVEESVV